MKTTTQDYKAGYETGYHGHRVMTKHQYTAGLASLEADWKEYRQGVKNGKEDKAGGYDYNDE